MKGQGTAEYVVLLAIVLVIALIGTMLLTNTGVDAAAQAESESYWKGMARPLGIDQWGQANEVLYLSISNNGYDHLFQRQVKVDNVTADLGSGLSWKSGGIKALSIPGMPRCGVNNFDSFAYNVTFVYDSLSIPGQVERGEKQIVGYCQTL
ncbi:Uncharacterised protein [uncultured archaeon]|nr:Uncharacterised protein [uncultured archaeon]